MSSGERFYNEKKKENFFRVKFAVADIEDESAAGMVPKSSTTVKSHSGKTWTCEILRRGEPVNIYMHPVDEKVMSDYGDFNVRIVNGRRVHHVQNQDGVAIDRSELQEYICARAIMWTDLHENYCVDGEFTVEFAFPTLLSRAPVIVDDLPLMKLENAIFTDVQVVCKDSDEVIDCNRLVICRASSAMLGAFSNPTSKESIEKKFVIGHDCATVKNVFLLVKSMYEGWQQDEMDNHAAELYLLADCYGCERIAVMAKDSIDRTLTLGTFWKIATTAVFYQHPILLEQCAKFANQLPKGVNEVLNLEEVGSNDTIAGVTVAVASLDKN